MNFRSAIYEVGWQAIDDAIVGGLKRAGEPVPADSLGVVCRVSHLCTLDQFREAIRRLEEQGRIRYVTIQVRNLRMPLLPPYAVGAYIFAGGGDRHGSR